jgi:hypothetical protein
MPVCFIFRRALLEDLTTALRTQDVVSEAEVFVEDEGALWNPLVAVLTTDIFWIWRHFRVLGRSVFHLGVCIRMSDTECEPPRPAQLVFAAMLLAIRLRKRED